jgi:aminoglycoside phosphotransferase (APT) family kinase protein
VPVWTGVPTWHHGDLDVRNWLVCDGRICGVIDWDRMGVGDPACDLSVAWKLHSVEARGAFRKALPVDDATWARARGWALWQAVGAVSVLHGGDEPDAVPRGRKLA